MNGDVPSLAPAPSTLFFRLLVSTTLESGTGYAQHGGNTPDFRSFCSRLVVLLSFAVFGVEHVLNYKKAC